MVQQYNTQQYHEHHYKQYTMVQQYSTQQHLRLPQSTHHSNISAHLRKYFDFHLQRVGHLHIHHNEGQSEEQNSKLLNVRTIAC